MDVDSPALENTPGGGSGYLLKKHGKSRDNMERAVRR
jgi:hypothetical protein